ncbi:MAG: tRNA (adenosine(37)-N6)-threonylcarbamoyltransferase complex ATPase subunit type 1 TsaE [Candidatus Gracilibacteria bacterium]|nr:tRNA (adenosine(37)-N6)-threonylcarbamoyltransferase complex ATPase subunit type 1 TsaE [Candidatus Gracilibacteria bacterium]
MDITKNETETQKLAENIAEKVKKGGVICLFGDLGSGKTTFAKGFAKALGIDSFSVKSPTYTYIRDYPLGKNKFYHIDLYRLETIDELLLQEIEEFLINEKNVIIIEWADKLKDYLPKKRIDICLEYLDENSRKINVFEQNE